MKSSFVSAAVLAFTAALAACGGASRTPAEYAADTTKAFAEHEGELRTCYEEVLASKPDAKGDVTVQFYWNTSNTEEGARLPRKALEISTGKQEGEANIVADKTNAPEEVTKCVTTVIGKARLRPAGSGVGNATWTFHFAPGAAPSAAPTPQT